MRADEKLLEFCRSFEVLYSKERCTPNMHMHMHIKESILKCMDSGASHLSATMAFLEAFRAIGSHLNYR